MLHETIETRSASRGTPPPAKTSPAAEEPTATDSTLSIPALVEQCRQDIQAARRGEPATEMFGLELLRYAVAHDDGDAWAGLEQCFGEIVRGWLHEHPRWEVACWWESEEYYVALAFERFRQIAVLQPVAHRTLTSAFLSLRASLSGAILETLRAHTRLGAVPMPAVGESQMEAPQELWEHLQRILPCVRDQRLAYLLYHCGLTPREIVQCCQEEWSDIQEVYRLRCTILKRLVRNWELTGALAPTGRGDAIRG